MIIPLLVTLSIYVQSPYGWTMSCSRWLQRSQEIMLDDKLPLRAKWDLISYLKSKVDEPCPNSSTLTKKP